MLIPESYREIEKNQGRSLRELGVTGVAFSRSDVLKALESLKGSQIVVLGGDVLKIVGKKLRYSYDNWHVDRSPDERFTDFLTRSIAESESYIRKYQDNEDGTVFYNLVISELGT